ncbi:MAG: NF038122 family metalloprotease [Lacipirellulaceae bacterium]
MCIVSAEAAQAVVSDPTQSTYYSWMPEHGSSEFRLRETVPHELNGFGITLNAGAGLQANPAALAAFQRAVDAWEAVIADPITITIDADLASLPAGVLGQASSVTLQAGYDLIRNQMVLDAADEADDLITAFLPTSANALFELPLGFGLSGDVSATKANLKALGFAGLDNVFGATDAMITFSTNFNFDFDNSDGVVGFDFETVAAHEIGHALGFISEVDLVDAALDAGTTVSDLAPSTVDLFRFDSSGANDPSNPAEFTTLPRSLVPGSDDSFDQITSLFGGDAEIRLSTGRTQGDGEQASHFKDFLGLGLFDPTLPPGVVVPIGPNDLRTLDLIGYEITQVPEPTTALLLAVGVCGLLTRRI